MQWSAAVSRVTRLRSCSGSYKTKFATLLFIPIHFRRLPDIASSRAVQGASRKQSTSVPSSRATGQNVSLHSSPSMSVSRPLRETVRSDIAKLFPKPESDDLVAAASLLRKRHHELQFPVPPTMQPMNGKQVDTSSAMEMLERLLMMPASEIHTFYERFSGWSFIWGWELMAVRYIGLCVGPQQMQFSEPVILISFDFP